MEVRKTLGLTQTEFGRGIKVSQAYFGNIEQKKRKINDRVIALICGSYGVNENWLRSGTGKMFDKPQDGKLERIIRNFKELDPLLQDYVIKQIDLAVEFQEIKDKKEKAR
jgi:transcriptional regulator with XRE-family HTH domain